MRSPLRAAEALVVAAALSGCLGQGAPAAAPAPVADARSDAATERDTSVRPETVHDTVLLPDVSPDAVVGPDASPDTDVAPDASPDTLAVVDAAPDTSALDVVPDDSAAAHTVADSGPALDTAPSPDTTAQPTSCVINSDCPDPTTPACFEHMCVECRENADCPDSEPVCDFDHTCVQCLPWESHASSRRQQACEPDEYCDDRTCVPMLAAGEACTLSSQCLSLHCRGGLCTDDEIPPCERPSIFPCSDCPAGYYCNVDTCLPLAPIGSSCEYKISPECDISCENKCTWEVECGVFAESQCDNVAYHVEQYGNCREDAAPGEGCANGMDYGCLSGTCADGNICE